MKSNGRDCQFLKRLTASAKKQHAIKKNEILNISFYPESY